MDDAQPRSLHVGIIGAGLGGLAAAIALARGGCKVTILEAASALGEIGAGIQMTPNVSRLLIRWGVSDIIGDNLVQCKYVNMRNKDGTIVQRTELYPKTVREYGFPWWVVRRDHLHEGLAEGARRHGVEIVVAARVKTLKWQDQEKVNVESEAGGKWEFDLVVGADGLKSIVRRSLFPDVTPRPPTNNAAYRVVMPYKEMWEKVPESRELFGNNIDVWGIEKGYVITYPISAGRDWNTVLSHYRDYAPTDMEDDVDMQEARDYFKDIDPRLKKVIDILPESKRWPLLVTGPLDSWSSKEKNVILMGDAAHSMTNHMAQGAATSMEDGAFLGRLLAEVVRGVVTLQQAIGIYEKTRMPRAWLKQQTSFAMGAMYMAADQKMTDARDESSTRSVETTPEQEDIIALKEKPEISGPDPNQRTWNFWGAPETVQSIFGYDPEGDADQAVLMYLSENTPWDKMTTMSSGVEKKWTAWWMPKEQIGRIGRSRGTKL